MVIPSCPRCNRQHPGVICHMTGDGAVVRLWDLSDTAGWALSARAMEEEHNAAIRQQAAEIERLTKQVLILETRDIGWKLQWEEAEARNAALLKALPIITVKTMELSGDRREYFVSIVCEDREVTPHKFNEQFKAEYEAAFYRFVFGQGAEPDMLAYSNAGWPVAAAKGGTV